MRDRVTLWSRVEVQGASGAITWTWVNVCTVWAELRYERGSKGFSALQLYGSQPVHARIRAMDGIRTNWRVTLEPECDATQYLEIISVIPGQGRRSDMELHCLMREADGWRTEKS